MDASKAVLMLLLAKDSLARKEVTALVLWCCFCNGSLWSKRPRYNCSSGIGVSSGSFVGWELHALADTLSVEQDCHSCYFERR
jgi:hypothetical protein